MSIHDEKVAEATGLQWSDELHEGEFDDLATLNFDSAETHQPNPPSLRNCNSSTSSMRTKQQQYSYGLHLQLVLGSLQYGNVNIEVYM